MEENKQIQTKETLDIDQASGKLNNMMQFMKQNLKKGNDYMSIGGGKPTLMKAGAEKMNILMGLSAKYEKTKEIINPKDAFYYVEVKCCLTHIKTGNPVAECIASCNNQEKARKHLDFADSLNVVLKMAEKRAYVGATLNANALSQFYTQDLEDETIQEEKADSKGAVLSCVTCGAEVSQRIVKYCKDTNRKVECYDCQKKGDKKE